MVDIESADAKSAPVISVRFKLASCFPGKEAEHPKKKMVPTNCMFFPNEEKRGRDRPPGAEAPRHLPDYPGHSEPTTRGAVYMHR
jgi:hypothetical protein